MIDRFGTALMLTLLAAFSTAATPISPSGTPDPLPGELEAMQPMRIEVHLSKRELHVYRGGSLARTFGVAIGATDFPTPTGTFRIDRIVWNPDWIPPDSEWARDETPKAPGDPNNPMQGAKIFFRYPAYYIHGTNAPHSIGKAASHGCLRMRTADVEELAEMIQRAGGAVRSDAWFAEMKRSKTKKTEVRLPEPVQMTIRR